MATTKHTLVALVEDKPGVLNRIASLFRRRGFNIESITVGGTEEAKVSRMTIVVDGATTAVEQVRKQLEKVIEVIKVADITQDQMVARELALVKVKATAQTRSVSSDSVVIEITGDEDKIMSLLDLLKGFGVKEIARTGRLAMVRG
jgi:acetolactate synthase-1/3 small subunit